MFLSQPNARIHCAMAIMATALGLWLNISRLEWSAIAIAIGLVMCAEAMNTALEHAVDLASPQWHAMARDAKDVAAAAVLIASVAALAVGLLVFSPHAYAWVQGMLALS